MAFQIARSFTLLGPRIINKDSFQGTILNGSAMNGISNGAVTNGTSNGTSNGMSNGVSNSAAWMEETLQAGPGPLREVDPTLYEELKLGHDGAGFKRLKP